jgi:methyl-accepting chemotaxis protein
MHATTVSAAVEEQSGVARQISGSIADTADRVSKVEVNMQSIEQAAGDTNSAATQVSTSSNDVNKAFGYMRENVESVMKALGLMSSN